MGVSRPRLPERRRRIARLEQSRPLFRTRRGLAASPSPTTIPIGRPVRQRVARGVNARSGSSQKRSARRVSCCCSPPSHSGWCARSRTSLPWGAALRCSPHSVASHVKSTRRAHSSGCSREQHAPGCPPWKEPLAGLTVIQECHVSRVGPHGFKKTRILCVDVTPAGTRKPGR